MFAGEPLVVPCDLVLDVLGLPVRLVVDGEEIEDVVLRWEENGTYTIDLLHPAPWRIPERRGAEAA